MASYEQSGKSKLWSVRFREINLDDGVERQLRLSGFKTKKDAQTAYREHVTAYEEEKALRAMTKAKNPQLDMTFDQLAALFFRSLEGSARESSVYTYESKYRRGIEEFFKGKKITDIKQLDIVEWKGWISAKGFSFSYKSDIRTVLNFIFKFGEDTFDFPNVAKKVKGFRDVNFEKDNSCGDNFLPPEDIRRMLDATEDEMYRRFFLTLFQTGCRRGELFSLRWSDVDEKRCTISITKSLSRKTKKGPYAITPPKTYTSDRVIYVSGSLVAELRKQAEETGISSQFLFGGNKPLAEKSTERALAVACESAGVKPITLHGLRHSCASALLSRGVNLVAVSKFLGHKSIKETAETYSHLLPQDTAAMANILAEIT